MSVTTNLVSNPSFETALSPWTLGIGAPGGLDRVSDAPSGGGSWCAELYKHLNNLQVGHYCYIPTRVKVTPGIQYEASAQAKALLTGGYTAGPVIVWYADSSGGSPMGTSLTASATVNTSTWVTATASAPCPAGAGWAEIRFATTGQPNDSDIHFDVYAFGPAAVSTGNLLPYSAQSMESGISNWTAKTNTTIAQTSTAAYAGTYSLQINATAAGNCSAEFVPPDIPITAGLRYACSMQARSSTGTPQCQVELQWYTAAGSYISSSVQLVTVNSTGWTLVATTGATAPAGAGKVRPRLWGMSLAAGAWIRADEVFLALDPVLPGNLLTAAEQGIEASGNDTLWSSQANATLSRSTTSPIAGTASLLDTAAAAGPSRFGLARRQAVTAGSWYAFGLQYKMPTAGAYQMRLGVDFYNASGTYLSTMWGPLSSTNATGLAGGALQQVQAPAGSATGSPVVEVTATAAAQGFRFDQMALTTSQAPWTALVDADNAAVALTFASPQPGGYYSTLSVWRTGPDGIQVPVRTQGGEMDGFLIGTSTLWAGTDYEAPLGVAVTYTALWQGSAIADFQVTTDPITVPPPSDANFCWIKHPGKPALNRLVMGAVAPNWKRDARQAAHIMRGRRMPLVISDVRGGHSGDLELFTWTDDDRQALDALLDDGGVLLVQAPAGIGFDGNLYAAVADTSEERLGGMASEAGRRWTLSLTEVDRVTGGMQGSASRTWNDILTDPDTPTWQDVLDTYRTWYDVLIGNKR